MKLEIPKGTRDFLPEEKIQRDKLIQSFKETFELYGFMPLETPAFERFEVLSSKYAGGEEILKETFKFKDQGKRDLALKYDLTVPMCRVIGMNQNLKMPFKRYQIERVWRDGPVQANRYREFYQCDIDIVGVSGMLAEAEILKVVSEIFSKLGFEFVIELNNRKLLNSLMKKLSIKEEKMNSVLLSIDKLEKQGQSEVERELREKGIGGEKIDSIMQLIQISGNNEKILEILEQKIGANDGLKELKELLEYCELFGVKNVQIVPSMVRGLSYYTGPVFEVLLKKGSVKSSIAAGGRYDKLIENFLDSKKSFPATGIAFGFERIIDELKEKGLKAVKTKVDLYIIPIGITKQCLPLIEKIRALGINCDFDLMQRGISKNLDYANAMNIPFVIALGENEFKSKSFKLKNMLTGKEETLKFSELEKLRDKIQ